MNKKSYEVKEKNYLKRMLKGFKQRFRNPNLDFEKVAKLYLNTLIDSYEHEDINLDYLAQKSYDEVRPILLSIENNNPKLYQDAYRYRLILDAFLRHYTEESCRRWD